MSSAAALAVDSGASSVLQTGLAQEQQTQGQTIAPLSDAVPSDYRQLMEQNNGQSFGTGFENAALQQGNTQADNASKSSPQSDNASKSLLNKMTPIQRKQWLDKLKQMEHQRLRLKLHNRS
jgi:hypothetical protein